MGEQVWGKLGEVGAAFGKSNLMISMGYIPMQSEPLSQDHIAQEDGTWVIPPEKLEELYQAELAVLDPLQSHANRHEHNGETDKAARAWLEFDIAQAEVMEKYGKGSTVLITENGECYHMSKDCSALGNSTNVVEAKLSDGLKNYIECGICAN